MHTCRYKFIIIESKHIGVGFSATSVQNIMFVWLAVSATFCYRHSRGRSNVFGDERYDFAHSHQICSNLITFAQISPQFFPNVTKFVQIYSILPKKILLGDAVPSPAPTALVIDKQHSGVVERERRFPGFSGGRTSGVATRGQSGRTRSRAKGLGAHQHTFYSHLKTRFK